MENKNTVRRKAQRKAARDKAPVKKQEDYFHMTDSEANELVFGEFAAGIEMYGLTDIGNK